LGKNRKREKETWNEFTHDSPPNLDGRNVLQMRIKSS